MAGRGKRKVDAVGSESKQPLIEIVPKKELDILSIAMDSKGNLFGLGNNNKIYRYVFDNKEWVMT